ncbi:hypothetical protein XENOCAPTIV_013214, partial [Xenoophorus captivus]
FEEQVLVKDFKTWVETSSSGKVDGGHKAFGEAKISADCDSVDGLAEPVSIKKKMVSLPAVRKKFSGRYCCCIGVNICWCGPVLIVFCFVREIKGDTLKLLKLKERDKLAIVYETVYNSGPVTIIKKSKKDGCISASFHKMANLMFKGNSKEDTTFTVPENSTFAFSLVEVLLEDGTMGIEMKEVLLKPLEELSESIRCDLLKGLQDVLEEGNVLSLLEETVALRPDPHPEDHRLTLNISTNN